MQQRTSIEWNGEDDFMRSSRNQHSHTAQRPVALKRLLFAAALLLALSACQAFAQITKNDFKFVNVADSTQGFGGFSQFPTINDRGAVAFVATPTGLGQGVFKWRDGRIRTIAQAGGLLSSFSDDVVINSAGVVGYAASVNTGGNDRAIFTSNGTWKKTIVDTSQQGLIGRFLGAPSINASGKVAFLADGPIARRPSSPEMAGRSRLSLIPPTRISAGSEMRRSTTPERSLFRDPARTGAWESLSRRRSKARRIRSTPRRGRSPS
jgi:hypothetical protein